MRTLLFCILMALVPLTNLQMVCFDHQGSGRVSVQADAGAADCADLCPRQKESPPETGCVLVAGGCSVLLAAVIGLHAPTALLEAAVTSTPVTPAARTLYLAPSLAHYSPPPEL